MDLREAIKVVQVTLGRTSEPTLVVDGRWGTFTRNAFEKASMEVKTAVGTVLRAYGTSVEELSKRVVSKVVKSARIPDAVYAAIKFAAGKLQVPASVLFAIAETESGFRPLAKNISPEGSFYGLFQMGAAAWSDVAKIVPEIGEFTANRLTISGNALAGAAYIRSHMLSFGRNFPGEAIKPAYLYLMHQQGASGFMDIFRAAYKGGPLANQRIRNMQRNRPQDGGRVTTDPKEFIERWVSVVDNRIQKY